MVRPLSRTLQGVRRTIFLITVIVPIVGALLALLPTFHYLLEVNRAFTLYRLGFGAIGFFWMLLLRKHIRNSLFLLSEAALLLLYLPCLLTLSDFYVRPQAAIPPNGAQNVKLLYVNVYSRNDRYDDFLAIVKAESPDLVALLEYTHTWDQALNLSSLYPYKISLPEYHDFGLALFSRYPLKAKENADVGEDLPHVIWTEVERSSGVKFDLTLLHAFPPVDTERFLGRRRLLKRVSTRLRHEVGNQLLVGDLNSTPFSFTYQFFTADQQFLNAMSGFGLFATWHAGLIRLTLDHILYRGNFAPSSFRRLPEFGSDHFPLLVEFSVW